MIIVAAFVVWIAMLSVSAVICTCIDTNTKRIVKAIEEAKK